MSRRWTAKCWMGTQSGYVDIEVGASSMNGAKEQLQTIYGAQQIVNLREIRSGGGSSVSMPSGGSVWFVGLLGSAALFLYFTPWVLMVVYGGLATWVGEKVTGQTLAEYGDEENETEEQSKKALITAAAALLFGGIGFIHGTIWNSDLNKEYNLDGKQSKVEQVSGQNNAR